MSILRLGREMTGKRDSFINQLVEDLSSERRSLPGFASILLWLLLSTVLVTILLLLVSPLRPGVGEQLLTVPRFLMETLLGVAMIIAVGAVTLKTAVPAGHTPGLVGLALALTMLWLSSFVVGLYFPTMELGMSGKREHCIWETLIYGIPTMVAGFWLVKRGYVLNWPLAGLMVGLVGGLIPGQLMQLACMYEAHHILMTHIAPAFLVAVLGVFAGFIIQYWPQRS